jgi:vacuolar-type H+-ATPase subunit H
MNSFQMQKILLSVFVCTALMACTDASITEVKKASIARSDFTFGELLDSPKGCASTDWDHHEENARPVVQYTCTVDLPQALIDAAAQDNANRIKELTKEMDKLWQDNLKRVQQRKEDVAQAIIQEGTQRASRIKQGQGALQEAQARLNQTLASSPQQYIGHGPSGYTPQLLAEGKERMQTAINSAMREVEIARRRLDESGAGVEPDSAYRPPTLGQGPSAPEYQAMIDGMLSWKDRYYAGINELEARELKRAEEFMTATKDRKLQMRITFLVPKQFPVDVQSATWIEGGKESKPVNPVYLTAALIEPKRLEEVLVGEQRSRLKFEVNNYQHRKSFPIECGEKIPTGCELKKEAS